MAPKSNPQVIPDRISSNLLDEYENRFEKDFAAHIAHEDTRKRIKEIFEECTETVAFKNKIKEYAAESFNERLFRNGWAILLFLGSLVVSGIIGRLIK